MKTFKIVITTFIVTLIGSRMVWSAPTLNSDPDFAWQQVQQAAKMPRPPVAWQTQEPTRDQIMQFYHQVADAATTAAGTAKAFYTKFPDSPNALAAKKLEGRMLGMAFQEGGQSQSTYTAWGNAETALLTDTNLTDEDRLDVRLQMAQRTRMDPSLDWKTRDTAYEKALRDVIKDYPQAEQPYEMLSILAAESPDDQARAIATYVIGSSAPDKAKETAQGILHRLDAVGKPVNIQFTAVDGRAVDLSQMKGKVVLVDFWATWCGPCVGEIPHVKAAYDKYHSKGFEIVGISFDSDKDALTHFVQSHDMAWPQYFDGQQWGNKFGQQFAIDSIPTMWLVDKNGNLYTENGREDLAGQVEKLLAQQ